MADLFYVSRDWRSQFTTPHACIMDEPEDGMQGLRLFAIGLLLGITGAIAFLPSVAIADHDLTCHPDSGWTSVAGGGLRIHDSGSEETVPVHLAATILMQPHADGTVDARGMGVLRIGTGRSSVLVADQDAATASCSAAGLTQFDLAFQSPVSREFARVSIVPASGPISTAGRHPVHLRVEYAGGAIEMDGAILVVSAADASPP